MHKKIVISVIFVIVAIVGVSIWYFNNTRSPQTYSGSMETIRLGMEMSFLTAPLIIAENKGYFKQEGVDIKLKEFDSGRNALTAMLKTDDLDVCTVAQTPVMFNSFNRDDYAIITAMVYSDNDVKLLVRKDKGIKKISDLKGKKIGVTKGSTGHYYLALFLSLNGMLLTEVNLVDINASKLPLALKQGRVDAISSWEPNIINARKLLGENAFLISQEGIFREDFYLVSKKKFIEKYPIALERLLKAVKKAQEFISANKEEAISIVAKKLNVDQQLASLLWDDFEFALILDETVITTLDSEARWAISEGLVNNDKIPNYLDFVNTDILKKVKEKAVRFLE